ncbi:MAG: Gfo/Idh/MocA family protein [Bacillota bacterium]
MRLAFIGFRHGHILQLYQAAAVHPQVQIVAACEEDPGAAEQVRQAGKVTLTHDNYLRMLDTVPCDAVAVGDCYAKRGRLIRLALQRNEHVISDKPLCTRADELESIVRLSRQNNLRLGCLLDLRGSAPFRTARRLIREGAIGEVHTINFTAQHPLLFGSRPAWYFEPGLHGGTINDIAVHAIDVIPWMTGRRIVQVVAARAWNARLPQVPHFQDAAQFMLRLDNNGGVLGDVSYLAAEGCGYKADQYWRMMFHGSEGAIECGWNHPHVVLMRNADKQPQSVALDPGEPNVALEAFLSDIAGGQASLSSDEVLNATRITLAIQRAADDHLRDITL